MKNIFRYLIYLLVSFLFYILTGDGSEALGLFILFVFIKGLNPDRESAAPIRR
jgi:hypothetical protein